MRGSSASSQLLAFLLLLPPGEWETRCALRGPWGEEQAARPWGVLPARVWSHVWQWPQEAGRGSEG